MSPEARRLFCALLALSTWVPLAAYADVEEEVEKRKVDYHFMVTSYYMFNAHRVSGPYNSQESPTPTRRASGSSLQEEAYSTKPRGGASWSS